MLCILSLKQSVSCTCQISFVKWFTIFYHVYIIVETSWENDQTASVYSGFAKMSTSAYFTVPLDQTHTLLTRVDKEDNAHAHHGYSLLILRHIMLMLLLLVVYGILNIFKVDITINT